MKKKFKFFSAAIGFFAVLLGAWSALASTENLPPFVEGSRRVDFCGNRQQLRDCYFSIQLPNYQDTIDYQAYMGAIDLYLTYAEEDFVNSDASVVVEMCLSQGPSFGTNESILCTTFSPRGKVGQTVIDRCKNGCAPTRWLSGSDRAGLGGFDREVNWANFHLRLDSVDGYSNVTVGGRRPSVLSAQYNPGSSEICWEAENVPNGDYILLRDPGGNVVSRGGPVARCVEVASSGRYRIEATGPGQAGPSQPPPATVYYDVLVREEAARHAACVNNACTIVPGPGADQCAPIGSFCGGPPGIGRMKCEDRACVFDPNGSGPDQCATNTHCDNGSHAACVSNTCTLVSGPGASTCGPVGSACGPGGGSSLQVEPSFASVYVGDSMTFRAMYDADGPFAPGGREEVTSRAAWSVSGPARMDGGRVWGENSGSATVRAEFLGETAAASLAITEPPPPSCTFTATPSRIVIPPPRSTTLQWSCEYAVSCSISPGIGPVNPNSGFAAVSPRETTRYALDCVGRRQSTTVEAEVGVRIFEFIGGKLKEIIPGFN